MAALVSGILFVYAYEFHAAATPKSGRIVSYHYQRRERRSLRSPSTSAKPTMIDSIRSKEGVDTRNLTG
jgi:hypothetical protein